MMKLTNKQKSIIQKSLKLNEDFFDDFDSNNLIDDTVDDSVSDPDYTYHIQFIIYMYPFIKDVYRNGECVYYFEEPKYKSIVESVFLSMKKSLDYILQASSLVTDYSKPEFCSFWRLQQIYHNLLSTNKFNKHIVTPPYIDIRVYRNNPYKKTNIYPLMQTDREFASEGLELIKFLNSKVH